MTLKGVIDVIIDNANIFVILVQWLYRAELQCKGQTECCDGTVIDLNATYAEIKPKYKPLVDRHALIWCDTTSYPYDALNTLLAGDLA